MVSVAGRPGLVGGAQSFDGRNDNGEWFEGNFAVEHDISRGCTAMRLTVYVPSENLAYRTDGDRAFAALRDQLTNGRVPVHEKIEVIADFVRGHVRAPGLPRSHRRQLELD